jgi:hypothetical protein
MKQQNSNKKKPFLLRDNPTAYGLRLIIVALIIIAIGWFIHFAFTTSAGSNFVDICFILTAVYFITDLWFVCHKKKSGKIIKLIISIIFLFLIEFIILLGIKYIESKF